MSKHKLLLIGLLLAYMMVNAQVITTDDLRKAVREQTCADLGDALKTQVWHDEQSNMLAAICLYRNGEVLDAMKHFEVVASGSPDRKHLARYWLAKCHASMQQDSMAWQIIKQVPSEFLTIDMLEKPEFNQMKQQNAEFRNLIVAITPRFNAWTILLSGVCILGYILSVMLFFHRAKSATGTKWLSSVVFVFSIILTSNLLYWTKHYKTYPMLLSVWQPLTFWIGPLLYGYLLRVFDEPISSTRLLRHVWLPVLVFLVCIPVIFGNFQGFNVPGNDFFIIGTAPVLMVAHLVLYSVLIRKLVSHEYQIDQNILAWTKILTVAFEAYTLSFLSYFMLSRASFFSLEWDYLISLVMALSILVIGYMGLIQGRIFRSEPILNSMLPIRKYRTSNLTESASLSIKRKLERLLNEEKVYRETELHLDDLAGYLEVSRHQLSQVINEHYGVNFFDFINGYRIAYVKQLLTDVKRQQDTIIQLAYEAGFNNKASFNRYFKKSTGMTPLAWRMMVQDTFERTME